MTALTHIQFKNFIDTEVAEEVSARASQIYSGVVSRTYVRTGQTRQSWNMSTKSSNLSTVDSGGENGSPLGAPITPVIKLRKPEKIFITNAKPHILYLEFGSSTVIPAAMVQSTLASLQ